MTVDLSDPLAHPIVGGAPAEPYPWRDNAYLGFWDPAQEAFGAIHVSTSPNAEGRRARASFSLRGRSAEVIEELPPGTFTGESISFDLGGRVQVRSADLDLDLDLRSVGAVGDYTASEVLPPLVEGKPLQHFQQGAAVSGDVRVLDQRGTLTAAAAVRDRTWGFRDESASMQEYVAIILSFEGALHTVMKFRGNDGADRLHGFWLDEKSLEANRLVVTRDAAGLVVGTETGFADGTVLRLRRRRMLGGFWVPMGVERIGPTLSVYDEFVEVVAEDGRVGYGICEQGVRRQLW